MDLQLTGRRVLITGGTRGIGRAIAETFAREGAAVSICARNEAAMNATLDSLRAMGARAEGSAFDIRDGAALARWVEQSHQALGGIDVVVSNASTRPTRSGEDMWIDAFDSDLLHHVRLVNLTLPHLLRGASPNLIFLASIASVLTQLPPWEEAYGAMKAGLVNLTGQLAARHGASGIRVNAVSPGPILFEGGEWDINRQKRPQLFAAASKFASLGRLGSPQEVANAVVFLASPAANYITGANLRIDGGALKSANF